jgi:hypothetical protein
MSKYRLPEIFGIGPGRTGTTWLHRVLEGHVDLPRGVKETEFFTTYYDRGIDWYASHFKHATGDRKIVEICPYLIDLRARDRIAEVVPNARIVATIRNPVDHAYSTYKLMRHYVWERRSFEEFVNTRQDLDRRNNYAFHLREWFEKFGRENVLVTNYDELAAAPQTYLDRVTDFIGIEKIDLSATGSVSDDVNSYARAPKSRRLAQNARHAMFRLKGIRAYRTINALERAGVWQFCYGRGEPFGPIDRELEARLVKRWTAQVEDLEKLLSVDLSAWKKPRVRKRIERTFSS